MRRCLDWTPERVDELRAVMSGGASYREAAGILSERWGCNVGYAATRLTCARHNIASLATASEWQAKRWKQYRDFWQLTGDWIICGDLQLPYVDAAWCRVLTETARRLKCRQLLVAGDIFDFEALGPFAAVVPHAHPDDERRMTEVVIDEWLDWFRDIRCLCGNHDIRLAKRLDGAVSTDDILSVLGARLGDSRRVQWSVYGYAIIDTPTGAWRVTHPRNYSRVPLSVAGQLATRFRQHVITFHEHATAIGFDRSGQSVVVNCGCMADPDRLAYRMLADSTHPEQTQSFVALTAGRVRLYSPHAAWGN